MIIVLVWGGLCISLSQRDHRREETQNENCFNTILTSLNVSSLINVGIQFNWTSLHHSICQNINLVTNTTQAAVNKNEKEVQVVHYSCKIFAT